MTPGEVGDGTIKSGRTILEVIELLRKHDGLRVSELADQLGASKSTAHRYLKTLHEQEYVVNEAGLYRVGLSFLSFGVYVRSRHEGHQMIREKVDQLAEETGERAQFMVPEHGKAVCFCRSLGDRAVRLKLEVGDRVPLHAISPGKAILAEWPDDRAEQYIDRNELINLTENTISDPSALRDELDQIEKQGFSQSKREFTGELNAVGVAITGPDGTVLGAIGVSGPTHRMTGNYLEEELPELVSGTAREITLNLQYAD